MRYYKKAASAKTGMSPGTAIYIGAAPPKTTQVLVSIYDQHSYQKFDKFDADAVNNALNENKQVWIDVCGLADNEFITNLCCHYRVHPLVVEDLLNTRQRPKLDLVGDYLFIVFKLLNLEDTEYEAEQFSILLKKNLLLTFRESNTFDFSSIYQRLHVEPSLIREHGVDYLSYLILDYIIDSYFNFVEANSQLLEEAEDQLINSPDSIHVHQFYSLKRRILTLRHVIAPLCDIARLLLNNQNNLIDARYSLYYHDLYDHCARLVESIDLHREMALNIFDIYLSSLNIRMNETMKILTIFASIFIPLTFITSLYGMNFKYMPELEWH